MATPANWTPGRQRYRELKTRYAKRNIRNATPAEAALWSHLHQWRTGYRAQRQYNIRGYLIDVAFPALRIAIEVDGPYHDTPKAKQYDTQRTQALQAHGYTVLRFTNAQVLGNTPQIARLITKTLDNAAQRLGITPRYQTHKSPCGRPQA